MFVLGEPLLELSSDEPLETAHALSLSFSGDALNAAAASAAAGVPHPPGEPGRRGRDRHPPPPRTPRASGVDTEAVRRGPEPTGAYLVGADPEGHRDFVYLRSGSAAAAMQPAHLDGLPIEQASVLLVSGIAMASSPSLADTVVEAARVVAQAGGQVVYDPNFRRRLATPGAMRVRTSSAWSRGCPSWCRRSPADSQALVETADPGCRRRAAPRLGCRDVVVTSRSGGRPPGPRTARRPVHVPALDPGAVRDATGAGDVFVGTLAAGLARRPPGRRAGAHGVCRRRAVAGRDEVAPGTWPARADVESLARTSR